MTTATRHMFLLNILQLMKLKGMTRKDLQEKIGVSQPTLAKWLSHTYLRWDMNTIEALAEGVDCDLEIKLIPRG